MAALEETAPTGQTPPSETPAASRRTHPAAAIVILFLLVASFFGLKPLVSWQRMGSDRALSLSNERRLGNALLLYVQDWDGRPMPPANQIAGTNKWQTWPALLKPYLNSETVFSNPSNPAHSAVGALHHPVAGYPVETSYALNRRLWGVFSAGAFPLESLEIPEQTALFVEAGPMWSDPLGRSSVHATSTAELDYGDTTDRYEGLTPYPSTHDGRMAVVAADGHGLIVTVAHYDGRHGRHDPLYGRIGGEIFDWNGGHPNGETDGPPHE